MKKTFNVDEKLLKEAKQACGAKTDTETIRLGLQALRRSLAYKRIQEYFGKEPDALDYEVPRRREKPARKRRVA